MTNEDIFRGLGIEVELFDDEDFLKVKETLSRIGIPSRKTKTLFPSTNILHKQGRYSLMMFKELFLMDNKYANISDDDIARRNTIALLLEEWGLLKIKDRVKFEEIKTKTLPMSMIKVLSYSEKKDWTIEPKYNIGVKNKFSKSNGNK